MKSLIFGYLKKIWHNSAEYNNDILKSLVTTKKEARILDIGFFRGDLLVDRFKSITKPEFYGIDNDPKAITSGKKFKIKTFKHDIEKGLPFKTNFFDIVSANQIIEHLTNIDLFVSEIYRVLKPNGFVILSTENLSSWHNIFALVLGWQAFSQHISTKSNIGNPLRLTNSKNESNDIHIKIFTPRGLKDLFKTYNFEIENTFGAGYYPFYGFVSKVLSNLDATHCAFIGLKARKPK